MRFLIKSNFLFFLVVLVYGCASLAILPAEKTIDDSLLKPLSDTAIVEVVDVKHPTPDSCILAGRLVYRGNISSAHSYNNIIESAKKEARTMGGNIVKVTNLNISNMYDLSISVYYRRITSTLSTGIQAAQDSLQKEKFGIGNPTYAILYVYRPNGMGVLVGYNIEVNGKVVCKAKNNSCYEIKLYKEGPTEVAAETSGSVTLNVKFGEEYYLKCQVQGGVLEGQPFFGIMPKWKGSAEYNEVEEDPTHKSN
jgi:hypothetical protein